jgi:hypothetical protein
MSVFATVLDAVDLGFRAVVGEDALCSSFDASHDAPMTIYRNRFSEQIELINTEDGNPVARLTPLDLTCREARVCRRKLNIDRAEFGGLTSTNSARSM